MDRLKATNWFDKDGKPLTDYNKIEKLLIDTNYKVIKQENVGKYWISTVWLGLNHNYSSGKPLIFETMIFGNDEEEQKRYSTLEEAKKGHKKMVAKWSKKNI